MKKRLLIIIAIVFTVLNVGNTTFAATSAVTPIDAEIQGGEIILELDQDTMYFSGTINKENPIIDLTLESEGLGWKVTDNRGVGDEITVQYTLTDFVNEQNDKLIPTNNVTINTPVTITKMSALEGTQKEGILYLEDLEFSNGSFVRSGNYKSNLTIEAILAPTP